MDSKQGFNACLRCKARKIKCDRETPKCTNCEKTNKPCLTTDPATGRHVPRSYLNHLENRVQQLERELELSRKDKPMELAAKSTSEAKVGSSDQTATPPTSLYLYNELGNDVFPKSLNGPEGSSITSIPGFGKSHNILVNRGKDEGATSNKPPQPAPPPPPPMSIYRSSFLWGLPVDLPPKSQAEKMICLFFEHGNATFPILHREQFIHSYFEPVYGHISPQLKLCSKYSTLNLKTSAAEPGPETFYRSWKDKRNITIAKPDPKIQRSLFFLYITFGVGATTSIAKAPEYAEYGPRYFALALTYYPTILRLYIIDEPLTRLQAALLLTLYGIIRPASPNAWTNVGEAMRLCIDMGLHEEHNVHKASYEGNRSEDDSFTIDMRRRLFWAAYSMDRVASIVLGRSSFIRDDYINCKLPSMADDSLLSPKDQSYNYLAPRKQSHTHGHPHGSSEHIGHHQLVSNSKNKFFTIPNRPSYKWVFHSQLILRKIQYRIRETLYETMHVENVEVMRNHRNELATELQDWYDSTPRDDYTYNFDWSMDTIEIDYLHTRVLLFKNSRGIPEPNLLESKFTVDASIRLLKLYVANIEKGRVVSPYGIEQIILKTATTCMHTLWRTDALNGSYDVEELEPTIVGVVGALHRLQLSQEASNMYCEPLIHMAKITAENLQRPDKKKRKRVLDNGKLQLKQVLNVYSNKNEISDHQQKQYPQQDYQSKITLPPIDTSNIQPVNPVQIPAGTRNSASAPAFNLASAPTSVSSSSTASTDTPLPAAAPAPAPYLPQPPQPPPQMPVEPANVNRSQMSMIFNANYPSQLQDNIGFGPSNVLRKHLPPYTRPSQPQLPIPVQQHHIQTPVPRNTAITQTNKRNENSDNTPNVTQTEAFPKTSEIPRQEQPMLPSFSSLQWGITTGKTPDALHQPMHSEASDKLSLQEYANIEERESAKAQMQGLFNSVAKLLESDRDKHSKFDRKH